ncbi:MAG TPA: hypothetical protein VH561_13425 [Micromonosporaceae bacterium]
MARTFSSLYIAIDIAWLLVYLGILLAFRKRVAVVVGLLMGIVYFLVDYGIYYEALGTRHIAGADPFWFELWFSMSYGLTNFAWIWLLLDRDGRAVQWSLLPILGWVAIAQVSDDYGGGFTQISISRGVGYHGVMAAILLVGYLVLIIRTLMGREKVSILWLMAIGIGVQFAWEAVLLLSGIRPPQWQPLVIDSLIETNCGMPIIFYIHKFVTNRIGERPAPTAEVTAATTTEQSVDGGGPSTAFLERPR